MERETTKKYYIVHSWMGALTAVLMFVIAYTGAFSVFGRPELVVWSNPEIREGFSRDYAKIEAIIERHAATLDPAYYDHVTVIFPSAPAYAHLVVLFERESKDELGRERHEGVWFEHHPKSLELVNRFEGETGTLFRERSSDMASFMVEFHASLHLGSPLGLALTGLLGLTLFVSIITGVFIHRKILKEMFVFRPYRSLRLLFTDSHKVIGVWGLLFHGMIAFTGAFLGLATVLLIPAAAYVSFGGDQEKLVETFLPEIIPVVSDVQSDMLFARSLNSLDESLLVTNATIYAWGDREAIMLVNTMGGPQLGSESHEFHISSAEHIDQYTSFGRLGGVSGPILDAMFPLHFGNFGGVMVKFVWFFLGLGTAVLAVSGAMIWFERRLYGAEGGLSFNNYLRLARFTSGSCAGVVLASLALFPAQLFLDVPRGHENFWLGVVFFVLWLLAILWSMVRHNVYQSCRVLIAISAGMALSVAPLNAVLTGDNFVKMIAGGYWFTAGVDLALFVSGAFLLWLSFALPAQRPARLNKVSAVNANIAPSPLKRA